MPKSYHDWAKQPADSKALPILGLGGDERVFVEEALEGLKTKFLASGPVDFNFEHLSAKSASMDQILASAKALPMMAEYRLVIITEADAIKSDACELFETYEKDPNPSTVLVFVFDFIDTRSKLQKILESSKSLYRFDHPKEREMLGVIRMRAKLHKLNVSDDAANLLVMEIGTSLMMLERAFEKLALACEDQVVTPALVEEQVAQTAFRDVFTLARAVILKDRALAAKALAELKAAQEVPLRLIGVLAWQFRVVLKARLYLQEKHSVSDVGSRLHLFGDRLDTILRAARLLDVSSQLRRLNSLTELDRKLKSWRASPWLLFDEAVLEML